MFESAKYQIRLWRLQHGRDKTVAKFKKLYADAVTQKKGREVREEIQSNRRFDVDEWDEEIRQLTTDHIIMQAQRLQLPLPDIKDEEHWFQSTMFGLRHLTPKGVTKMRADIRAERKALWDFWQTRVMLMLALIGGLFGVLAYFKK